MFPHACVTTARTMQEKLSSSRRLPSCPRASRLTVYGSCASCLPVFKYEFNTVYILKSEYDCQSYAKHFSKVCLTFFSVNGLTT